MHPRRQGIDVEGIQPVADNEVSGSGVNAICRCGAAITTNDPIFSNHQNARLRNLSNEAGLPSQI